MVTNLVPTTNQSANRAMAVMPVMEVAMAIGRRAQLASLVKSVLIPGVDYGAVPGTDKPTLLKPGAEKINTFFGLTIRLQVIEMIEDWTGEQHGGEPLFYYWYRAQSWYGDMLVAEADGSCNSREAKYRWRWVPEEEIPYDLDRQTLKKRGGVASEFDFAVDKGETSGKYGKSAEYWQKFRDAIQAGTARKIKKQIKSGATKDAWEIDTTVYRIPNDDIASQVNTVKKMAQKRAYVGVTLPAANASEFFTQDMEDYIEGDYIAVGSAAPVESVIQPTDHFKPAEPTPQPEAPKTNGNGNGIGVTTGAELLELVNRRVGVPYDNVFHLQEAIKGDLPGFKWPSPKDKDGWQRAYDVAMAHARAKEQPAPEPPAVPVPLPGLDSEADFTDRDDIQF